MIRGLGSGHCVVLLRGGPRLVVSAFMAPSAFSSSAAIHSILLTLILQDGTRPNRHFTPGHQKGGVVCTPIVPKASSRIRGPATPQSLQSTTKMTSKYKEFRNRYTDSDLEACII